MTRPSAEPLSDVVARALDALETLGLLGEEIEDEWTYVTDLGQAQRVRLESIADRRPSDDVLHERAVAVDLAIEEIGRITDPHKAIDWLSTFTDLVALALDEPVGGSDIQAGRAA
ncbi:MAG TPA: hypothetical protein VK656_02710 [Candidatus Acidoferrum sp.]|nr:hypothetical protein [Candidatus Acidoferrum sp.]